MAAAWGSSWGASWGSSWGGSTSSDSDSSTGEAGDIIGIWEVECAVCRKVIHAFEAVKRWDGLIVAKDHSGCFEIKHPRLMPMPIWQRPRRPSLPVAPHPEEVESAPACSLNGQTGIVGYGIAGCSIVGRDGPVLDIPEGTFNEDTL